MYRKTNKILSNTEDLSNYINEFDVYDSYLLYKLRDPSIQKDYYEITVYEYRPDLIARDFYGSVNYTGLLFLQSGLILSDFTKGTVLSLIPKNILDNIIKQL